jgi:hypothetical protein
MDRLLVVIFGIPIGLCFIIYRFQLKQFTGEIGFAEQYLGSGGTYNLYILIGILVFIGSLMYGTGSLQEIYLGTIGKLFVT